METSDITEIVSGIVVQLKSGGQKMTCTGRTRLDNTNLVECQWFDKSTLRKEVFSKDCLTAVPANDPTPVP